MGDAGANIEIGQKAWRSVADRFSEHASLTPDRLAVETEQATLSYAALSVRVERFAARIAARLLDGNRLVGVCLDRNVDLPAWLLAVFRVGGAYMPLDSSLPPARLDQMLEDAQPALIVACRANLASLPATSVPILIAEENEDARPAPAFPIRPNTLAYLIYTSGSTGRPKGVEIEHGSLSALMTTMANSPGFVAGQKMLGLTRISFDLSVPDMFLPFVVGGSLSLVGLDVASDPERLSAAFARFQPDLVQGTPSTWRALLEWGWRGRAGMRILAGGEAMTRDLADRLLPCCGELWNIYGPTEATVWSTACRVRDCEGAVPIGWPLENVAVYVTDATLRLLPAGEVGEIVIGGSGVARGYRNRPELTRERFVHLADGTRVYRTGDLGRFSDDGVLFCLGRSDDQVKLRGFRIELGDVEAALAADPAVAWCAARLVSDAAGEPALVGYIVPRAGETPRPADIKAALAMHIPAYMVPDRICAVAAMPLTPNGKVDRASLPSPYVMSSPADSTGGNEPPIQQLAAIWRELLGVEAVEASDDFFDLGGYSLMTVRLTRRIEAAFGVKLALMDLMRASTLSAMAERIVSGTGGSQTTMLLNEGGNLAPLYWIDAGPLMRTMARELPSDQPAVALNLSWEDEAALDAGWLSVEGVAARLRERLIEIQPSGAYRVGGWCRWGIVAYEVAQQLRREGREVALLVLLDADRPGMFLNTRSSLLGRISRLLHPATTRAEPVSLSQRVEQAAASYEPACYDGDVLLVRPRSAPGDGGWHPLLPRRLTVARTGGNHESMVRHPHVCEVASAIGLQLESTNAMAVAGPKARPAQAGRGGSTVHAALACGD